MGGLRRMVSCPEHPNETAYTASFRSKGKPWAECVGILWCPKAIEDWEGKDLLDKIEKAGVNEVSLKTLVLEKDGVGIDDRSVERLAESAARRGGWIHYPVVQKRTMGSEER